MMQERPTKIVGEYHMPGFIEFCNGNIYSWMVYKSILGALSCTDDMKIYLLLTERWDCAYYAPTIIPLNVNISNSSQETKFQYWMTLHFGAFRWAYLT